MGQICFISFSSMRMRNISSPMCFHFPIRLIKNKNCMYHLLWIPKHTHTQSFPLSRFSSDPFHFKWWCGAIRNEWIWLGICVLMCVRCCALGYWYFMYEGARVFYNSNSSPLEMKWTPTLHNQLSKRINKRNRNLTIES